MAEIKKAVKPQSKADRALAARNAERGLTKVAVWVPESYADQLKTYARKLRDEYLNSRKDSKKNSPREKPNPSIAAIAREHSNLKMQVNIGQRHRFRLAGVRGSLWVEPQSNRYRVKLTGDVVSLVWPLARKLGNVSEDDGYPVVYVESHDQVSKCLAALAEST